MPGVRDAAVALIAAASESAVIAALRLLLDDIAPTSAPRLAPETRTPPPPPLRPAPAPLRKPTTAAVPIDEGWEELRRQVKAAMAERDASYADVAAAIGRSDIGVRISLGSRKPPKPIVRTRLQTWLEAAPEVASPAATFPGSSTGHRGNGHADGPYGHASAA
jgi:hypothetical protein